MKRLLSGSFWGILAKILDALAKFVTIPMLVTFYGRSDYGLIALAFSLNAYLRLMDLGFNVGAVRYFSIWVANGEWPKIRNVSGSSVVFYGVIGLLNAAVFLGMSAYGPQLFGLTAMQEPVYRQMMYILAASVVFSWVSGVVIQLLTAKDELPYVNQITTMVSVLNFAVAVLAIQLQWPLIAYFVAYTLVQLTPIPFYVSRLRVYPLRRMALLMPRWNGVAFREVLSYSLTIFAMGVFQLTANHFRPLLLGKFGGGTAVLTDYRVMQTVAMLIVAIGGVFMQVLLPSASKAYAEGDSRRMERLIFESTRYISAFLAFMVFVLILNAGDLLALYMGEDYRGLSAWLSIWLLTVLLSLHNTPVASLVLSTGKTKPLVYSSGIACMASLPVTALLADSLQAGAAVVGYLVYMVLQVGFFYGYYIPRVLQLNGSRLLLHAFLPAVAGASGALVAACGLSDWLSLPAGYGTLIVKTGIFAVTYGLFLLVAVVRPSDIQYLKTMLNVKGRRDA